MGVCVQAILTLSKTQMKNQYVLKGPNSCAKTQDPFTPLTSGNLTLQILIYTIFYHV